MRLFCFCFLVFAISGARGDTAFDLAQLDRLLLHSPRNGKTVQNLDELLPLLPAEFRENFTLIYETRGLARAEVTPNNPRVVMFRKDARLVLAFTTVPGEAHYNALEVMSFDDRSRSFVFSERTLPLKAEPKIARTSDVKCMQCHGLDARPVFDSYPIWPGFYGSVHDSFLTGSSEEIAFKSFKATQKSKGLYRHLKWKDGDEFWPYVPTGKLELAKRIIDPNFISRSPNTRLGVALSDLNRKRLYRRVQSSSIFAKAPAAKAKRVLYDLMKCGGETPASPRLTQVLSEIDAEGRLKTLRASFGLTAEDSKHGELEERLFAENLALSDEFLDGIGVSRMDASLALEPYSRSLFDGVLSATLYGKKYYINEDLALEILEDLSKRELLFRKYYGLTVAFDAVGFPIGRRLDLARAKAVCADPMFLEQIGMTKR